MFLRRINDLSNTLIFRLTILYAISFILIASLGFGLGLSLAKAYTESMNGIIDVRSTLSQGTIFTISFQQQLTDPLFSK